MNIGGFGNFNFGIRSLNEHHAQVAQSLERLATGKKINRASDDPSGMVAAEEHKVRIYAINAQLKSIAQQEGFLGAKEGGLSVINDQFVKLNELVVRAANNSGNSLEEKDALKLEINSTLDSINQIATATTYKGQQILTEFTLASFSTDPNTDPNAEPEVPKTLAHLAELAFTDPEAAQTLAKDAVDRIATSRGAIANRLDAIDADRSVLSAELVALTGSLSDIQDTDYAAEAAKLVRAQILEQASLAAISINRQNAQQVLGLISDAAKQGKQIAASGL